MLRATQIPETDVCLHNIKVQWLAHGVRLERLSPPAFSSLWTLLVLPWPLAASGTICSLTLPLTTFAPPPSTHILEAFAPRSGSRGSSE